LERIFHHQRVGIVKSVIEPRAERGETLRGRHGCAVIFNLVSTGIQNLGADDAGIVNIALLDVEEERCFLADGSAEIAAILP